MTDDDPRYREFRIGGELPDEHWDAIIKVLGYQNIFSVEVHPVVVDTEVSTSSELEPYSGAVLNRGNFYEHAAEIDKPKALAGRAWNTLTRLYVGANTETYKGAAWYDPTDYEHCPLVFDIVPPDTGTFKGVKSIIDGLEGLHLDSLDNLLKLLDKKIEQIGDKAYSRILGWGANAGTAGFLRSVAEHTRKQPVINVTDKQSS